MERRTRGNQELRAADGGSGRARRRRRASLGGLRHSAEGEVSKESDKYVGGKSTQGVGFYSGPCTPPGSPHHYTFIVVATDFDPKELPAGLTREEFLAKLVPQGAMSHAKGAAGLVGLF